MEIQGKKIKLRDWQTRDIPVYRQWNIGHHTWMEFDGPYYPKMTEDEVRLSIERINKRIEENNFPPVRERMNICDLENDVFIGQVSSYWQSKETNWLSIGIVIYDEAFWSRGIGAEALDLWCAYLFKNMPELARLDLRTWSGNKGMMKLAEKIGFKLEAVFRKARIVKGKYFDSIGYGILREEFERKY